MQRNPRGATGWWQQAEHLYAEIDEREGRARCLQHLGSAELVAGRAEKARELLELSELLRGGNAGHPILTEYLQAAREAGHAPVLLEEHPRVGVGGFRRQLVRLWHRWIGH
jgi:hypothetical protein